MLEKLENKTLEENLKVISLMQGKQHNPFSWVNPKQHLNVLLARAELLKLHVLRHHRGIWLKHRIWFNSLGGARAHKVLGNAKVADLRAMLWRGQQVREEGTAQQRPPEKALGTWGMWNRNETSYKVQTVFGCKQRVQEEFKDTSCLGLKMIRLDELMAARVENYCK